MVHGFALAQVRGTTAREPSRACPPGSLPDRDDQTICFKLERRTSFTANVRLITENGRLQPVTALRLTLPERAEQAFRDLTADVMADAATQPMIALVADGTVLAAPLHTQLFRSTTYDLNVAPSAAETLLADWRTAAEGLESGTPSGTDGPGLSSGEPSPTH